MICGMCAATPEMELSNHSDAWERAGRSARDFESKLSGKIQKKVKMVRSLVPGANPEASINSNISAMTLWSNHFRLNLDAGIASRRARNERLDVAQRRARSVETIVASCAREWERMAESELYIKFSEVDSRAANGVCWYQWIFHNHRSRF